LFNTGPSPFTMIGALGEHWWQQNAWGLCSQIACGTPNSYVLPGEKTGLESVERRNANNALTDGKKSGYMTDLIWGTNGPPDQDWAAVEAATVWDPLVDKYKYEGTFKLPRHMHDILSSRSFETSVDVLRDECVSGQPERRLYSSISQIDSSLDAIDEVFLFR
ncbi:hypothetical protein BGZ76_005994, partial [Entomortierella beljakovae]